MHLALNGWFWDQPYTGSGQYLRELVGALRRFHPDIALSLILPAPPIAHVPQGITLIEAKPPLSGKAGKVWFEQRSYPAAVRKSGADVAHVPYWGAPLDSPVPLVVSVLDVIPLVLPVYAGGLPNKAYISLQVAAAKGASHILTLSEASKRDIITHLQIPGEKITATHLAAEERFSPVPDPVKDEAVRRKYELPDDFALYFGGFDVRKSVNTILLAWTYVGQAVGQFIPLVLAGRQPAQWGTPLYPDLKDYAHRLDIEKYLLWLGEVDEADKPSLYRLAKLVVWASLYEGFGLPPLEAMASGTPVVAVNASSTPEVVGDAAYLVEAENAREMGGAILALLVQDDLHQHQANLARGQATRFSWRKTAQQSVEVYQQVLLGR